MTQGQINYYYGVKLPSGRVYTYSSPLSFNTGDVVLVSVGNNTLPLRGVVRTLDAPFPNARPILGAYPTDGCPYKDDTSYCMIVAKSCTHPNPPCVYWGCKNV